MGAAMTEDDNFYERPVDVLIYIRPESLMDANLANELAQRGVRIRRSLDRLRIVFGTVDPAKIDEISALPEVAAVERNRVVEGATPPEAGLVRRERPPIGTRIRLHESGALATVVPTHRGAPPDEVDVMHHGSGLVQTVRIAWIDALDEADR